MVRALGAWPLGRDPLAQYAAGVPTLAGLIIGTRNSFDSDTGSYTLPEPLLVDLFAWGGGGTGATHATQATAGGGGSAGYARLRLGAGTTISWTVPPSRRGQTASGVSNGANGTDTVVTIGQRVMTAQGGRGGRSDSTAAARSVATGFDVNRYGGGSGERGEFGALPYAASVFHGGGAGGFMDMFPGVMQAKGLLSSSHGEQGALVAAPPPGTGGGSKMSSTDGNDGTWAGGGMVLALMYRV